MRCSCAAVEAPHHHVQRAIYVCEDATSCKRCRDYEDAVWQPPGTAHRQAVTRLHHLSRRPGSNSPANPHH